MNLPVKPLCLGFSVVMLLMMAPSLEAQLQQGGRFDLPKLQLLAESGNPDAQFELGIRYLGGEGIARDEAKAAEWLKQSANQHNLEAMNALGTLHEEGVGLPKDEKKAFEWYEKAAKYGLPLAQQNLAQCYEKGVGVKKDSAEALKWIERAANQDFAPAQAAYAWKLEKGDGTAKDTMKAADWYLKAAQDKPPQGGLIAAMSHLAYLYYTGTGVPLDYRRAEAWYRRAARSGNPMALNDLAWFLSVCPDVTFHDGETAVELARNAVEKLEEEPDYQVVDTLAAALARAGKFGEALQLQTKAMVMFNADKSGDQTAEDREKIQKELAERLEAYRQQKAFTEKEPTPEAGTKPLVEDRILQEEAVPRKKPKSSPKDGTPDRRAPVVML